MNNRQLYKSQQSAGKASFSNVIVLKRSLKRLPVLCSGTQSNHPGRVKSLPKTPTIFFLTTSPRYRTNPEVSLVQPLPLANLVLDPHVIHANYPPLQLPPTLTIRMILKQPMLAISLQRPPPVQDDQARRQRVVRIGEGSSLFRWILSTATSTNHLQTPVPPLVRFDHDVDTGPTLQASLSSRPQTQPSELIPNSHLHQRHQFQLII